VIPGNGRIFYVAILGALLVVAVMYFLTQYVANSNDSFHPQSYPPAVPSLDTPLPPDDGLGSTTYNNGGAYLIIPPGQDPEPAVYFSWTAATISIWRCATTLPSCAAGSRFAWVGSTTTASRPTPPCRA